MTASRTKTVDYLYFFGTGEKKRFKDIFNNNFVYFSVNAKRAHNSEILRDNEKDYEVIQELLQVLLQHIPVRPTGFQTAQSPVTFWDCQFLSPIEMRFPTDPASL